MPLPPITKPIEEITEDDFEAYEETRRDGSYNMMSRDAQLLSGLDRDTYFSVLHHYSALSDLYPMVRGG